MRIEFKIQGEPTGKGRPRFSHFGGRVQTYTPEKTANYEQWVRLSYQQQCNGLRFEDDVFVKAVIYAYFTIPKSASHKKRMLMQHGAIKPAKKPDVDNIVKIILDSLNGLAYRDDSQVTDCIVAKRYVTSDNQDPYVKVELSE